MSKIAREDPTLEIPNSENDEPTRAKLLRDIEEPM
jgi:hypothetical protein